jgi:AraC family transcriptional regulator
MRQSVVQERGGWDFAAHMGIGDAAPLASAVLERNGLGLSHVRSDRNRAGVHTAPYEPHEAYLIVLRLTSFRVHDLWVDGKRISHDGHAAGTLSIYDLDRRWQARMQESFDCLQFHVNRRALDDIADRSGVRGRLRLNCAPSSSRIDETAQHLASVLLPAVSGFDTLAPLFLEHLNLAFHAHLVSCYGNRAGIQMGLPSGGGLAPWQLRRAIDFLTENLAEIVSIEAVADECGLSRSHFGKAFKQSVGLTPSQWVLEQRLDMAKRLIRQRSMALSEVAGACGFSDQSHLTRMFSRREGMSPGEWRRHCA